MHTGRLPEEIELHALTFLPPTQIIQFREVSKRYSKMIPQWIRDQQRFCEIFNIKIEQLQDLFQANYHLMPMRLLAVCIEDYMLKVAIIDRMKAYFWSVTKEKPYVTQQYLTLCCNTLKPMYIAGYILLFSNASTIKTEALFCQSCKYRAKQLTHLFERFTATQLKSIPHWSEDQERRGRTVKVFNFPEKYVNIAAQLNQAVFCAKSVANSAEAGSGAGAGRPLKRQKTQ